MKKRFLSLAKKLLGKTLTRKIRPLWHSTKARVAAWRYGHPGKKLKIIGITGTKGKTTTSMLTARLLNLAGIKTGLLCSAAINFGTGEKQNEFKMSTLDAFDLQRSLVKMNKNGCEVAVVEMTSIGLEQGRHLGIGHFDSVVFLNLFPEHIEAHGSLENYVQAKAKLFAAVSKKGFCLLAGEPEQEQYKKQMLQAIPQDFQSTVSKKELKAGRDYTIIDAQDSFFKSLSLSDFPKTQFQTHFFTRFDPINLTFALTLLKHYHPTLRAKQIQRDLKKLNHHVPGRMDFAVLDGKIINEKTNFPKRFFEPTHSESKDDPKTRLSILVDYAHEPESMKQLLMNLNQWRKKGYFHKIIHLVSCDGAGRDDWKKPILGKISLEHANLSILTTDNYDKEDNPQEIVDLLSQKLPKKQKDTTYFLQIDRKKAFEIAIEKADEWANKGEFVLIVSTGVGNEYGLTQPGGIMNWDEKKVWQEIFGATS